MRIEVATALKRGIPVIPIMLEGTRVPKPAQLPDDLQELAERNGLDVRHASFHLDMDKLIRGLRPTPAAQSAAPLPRSAPTEGRIKVDARIVHGAPSDASGGGWFKPGGGKTEWFKDHEAGPEMVVVPAGRFTMGSPGSEPGREPGSWAGKEDQIAVTIARPFAVGRCAVTRGEFAAFVHATGYAMPGPAAYGWTGTEWKQDAKFSWKNPGFAQDDRHPVVCVNWDDAKAYAEWLANVTGEPTYRLLSEAEWEYVARANSATPFWWGTAVTPAQANYDGTVEPYKGGGAKGVYREGTLPVDYAGESFRPTPWGLHQVHGNTWEWCADCWNETNAGNPGDGSPRTSGECSRRVVRGGSWNHVPQSLRSAYRSRNTGVDRLNYLGFRVGRTLTS